MTTPRRSIHDLVYGRQYKLILRLSFSDNEAPAPQYVVDKIDASESCPGNARSPHSKSTGGLARR